jgi:hypothetical protein
MKVGMVMESHEHPVASGKTGNALGEREAVRTDASLGAENLGGTERCVKLLVCKAVKVHVVAENLDPDIIELFADGAVVVGRSLEPPPPQPLARLLVAIARRVETRFDPGGMQLDHPHLVLHETTNQLRPIFTGHCEIVIAEWL